MVTNANDIFVMNLEKNEDKKEIIMIIINMKKREHTRLAAYDEAIYLLYIRERSLNFWIWAIVCNVFYYLNEISFLIINILVE